MSRAKSSVALVGFLLVLLPILAVLQYQWIGGVSTVERERLESSLRTASERLAGDFATEIARLANSFQFRDGFPSDVSSIIERYNFWAETASHPPILEAVYLLKMYPDSEPNQFKIDFQAGELRSVRLQDPALRAVRDRLRPSTGTLIPWTPGSLTLMSPITHGRSFDSRQERRPPPGVIEGVSVAELDRDALLKEMMPAMVQKHFSSHDQTAYRVALVNTADQPQVLYSSEGPWTREDIAAPDASIAIFGGPQTGERRGGRGRGGPGPVLTPIGGGGDPSAIPGQQWVLLVTHRSGSLERAVEQLRWRNLAISFGILLVLGAGVVTVFISSQRARTLGRLQMEFAAGISHELRTPLAVIRSAAHNLRSGVVRDKESVEQYATIVQDEARRLSDMVEEVLLYSETQSGRKKFKMTTVDVTDVVDRAIANLSPAIDLGKCDLTTQLDADLPAVQADPAALTQCLQNLLSNAFKYGRNGGDNAHIRIEAKHQAGANDVQLSVVDEGPGVDPVDVRNLFEPFYRGVRVGSNVPGNGLGLHLVQRIMQAQQGRITFSPAEPSGACFTLHIPVAEPKLK
jgi:signal transduction histidine kinase